MTNKIVELTGADHYHCEVTGLYWVRGLYQLVPAELVAELVGLKDGAGKPIFRVVEGGRL